MFQGSAPQGAIKVIGNIVKEWDCKRIYGATVGQWTLKEAFKKWKRK